MNVWILLDLACVLIGKTVACKYLHMLQYCPPLMKTLEELMTAGDYV